jgi:exodeoxyribonuclease V alpha subunit
MKKGDAGVEALNELLREELNPLRWVGDEFKRGFRTYRNGDRIIQTKNDYHLDLFNGDGGIIVGVDGEERTVDVDFGDRVLTLENGQLDNIMPAFALTIHKSQGSEYPVVIVVLSKSHRIMLRRRLLYTAVTRARTLGVLIGNPGAVAMAVKTTDDFSTRHTGLMEKLQAGVLDAPPLEDDDDEF